MRSQNTGLQSGCNDTLLREGIGRPQLQKIMLEQPDPLGSLLGASGCHHQVFLDAFSRKSVLLFCWQCPLWVEKKPWKYVCVRLRVCSLIILLKSSLSWLQAGLYSCAQGEKALSNESTKGTSQKGKHLPQRTWTLLFLCSATASF